MHSAARLFMVAGICIVLARAPSICAQHWVNPDFECHRLDLRDLGYPEVNQIPANSSAVTSLLAARNRKVYGGTSGEEAFLFVYDPAINKVRHLGKIKGQQGIHHALVEDGEGFIYFGTGMNILRQAELTRDIPNENSSIDKALWNDIRKPYLSYEGGHLYRYNAVSSDKQVLMADALCPADDLGVAVVNNGVYALGINASTRTIYGIAYPEGYLFEYQISQGKFRNLGELDRKVVFHGPERDWRSLPRALVVDDSGKVFTSGEDGYLVCYDSANGRIESTGLRIPGEYYPVQAYVGHPVIECLVKDENGLIYGGSSDGFLFSFDPAKRKLINLGKPRISRRMRALAIGKDRRVYLIAGERFEPCRLFCYDPRDGGFKDLGVIAVDRSPYYSWRGYQFDSMATGHDGTIYIGESERRSHLFLFIP